MGRAPRGAGVGLRWVSLSLIPPGGGTAARPSVRLTREGTPRRVLYWQPICAYDEHLTSTTQKHNISA
jgi:hypothetical protein